MGNCLNKSSGGNSGSSKPQQVTTGQPISRNEYVTEVQDRLPPPPNREAPPTPPFPNPNAKVVVGLYSYAARTDDDLSFNKGNSFYYVIIHIKIRFWCIKFCPFFVIFVFRFIVKDITKGCF